MPPRKTIRVRAGDGLRIPLPREITIDTGVTVLTPETTVEVLWNRFTRRRLDVGDFVADGDVTEREDPADAPRDDEEETRQTAEMPSLLRSGPVPTSGRFDLGAPDSLIVPPPRRGEGEEE